MPPTKEELIGLLTGRYDELRRHAALFAQLGSLKHQNPAVFACAGRFLLAKALDAAPKDPEALGLKARLEPEIAAAQQAAGERAAETVKNFVADFVASTNAAFKRGPAAHDMELLRDLTLARSYLLMLAGSGSPEAIDRLLRALEASSAAVEAALRSRVHFTNRGDERDLFEDVDCPSQLLSTLAADPLSDPPRPASRDAPAPASQRQLPAPPKGAGEEVVVSAAPPLVLQSPAFAGIFPLKSALRPSRSFSAALDLNELLEAKSEVNAAPFEKIFANAQSRANIKRFLVQVAEAHTANGRLEPLYFNLKRLREQMNA